MTTASSRCPTCQAPYDTEAMASPPRQGDIGVCIRCATPHGFSQEGLAVAFDDAALTTHKNAKEIVRTRDAVAKLHGYDDPDQLLAAVLLRLRRAN